MLNVHAALQSFQDALVKRLDAETDPVEADGPEIPDFFIGEGIGSRLKHDRLHLFDSLAIGLEQRRQETAETLSRQQTGSPAAKMDVLQIHLLQLQGEQAPQLNLLLEGRDKRRLEFEVMKPLLK